MERDSQGDSTAAEGMFDELRSLRRAIPEEMGIAEAYVASLVNRIYYSLTKGDEQAAQPLLEEYKLEGKKLGDRPFFQNLSRILMEKLAKTGKLRSGGER